jgi:hypothetical protein
MSVLWWFVVVLLAWRLATWSHRRRREHPQVDGSSLRRRPRRVHRLGDRRRRGAAELEARALVTRLATNDPGQGLDLAAGVVLRAGEIAWLRAPAHLSVWASEEVWVTSSRRSLFGRSAESVGASRVRAGWRVEGNVEWLITSARLAGRLPRTGELLSIPWASVAGLEVDLAGGQVRVQTANGWRCVLSGPGVAPIAVAGVAACHGVAALGEHPGLARLRDGWHRTDPVTPRRPEPLGQGEPEQPRPPRLPRW